MWHTTHVMERMQSETPRVAILLQTAIKTHREMLLGVLRYAREHGPWIVQVIEGRRGEQTLTDFKSWNCTGIIGSLSNVADAGTLLTSGLPMVAVDVSDWKDVYHQQRGPDAKKYVVGIVECRNEPIGIEAAKYFLERGFANYAFVGETNDATWSRERLIAYRQTLARAGYGCEVYEPPSRGSVRDASTDYRALCAWIKALPKPTAVFVAYDMRGRQVIDACLQAGVQVPQELSILSVDDDETICETATPQLSSIRMTAERAGYEGALVLARAMRQFPRRPTSPVRIEYSYASIVARASSDETHINDPLVERALAYIRAHAEHALTVKKLCEKLSVSRRLMELRFKRTCGCTVYSKIMQIRMERVKARLSDSTDSIETLAEVCGFASASHFCATFKRFFGISPAAYRRALR